MNQKLWKFIYWAPRILAIIFLLFLMIFSFDVFGQGYGFWGTALAFFMHNIPVIILGIIIAISWKYEIVGGIAFILAGLLYITTLIIKAFTGSFEWYMLSWSLLISGPAFLVGALFLVNWLKKK